MKEFAHKKLWKNYDVKQKWQNIWVANLEIVDGVLVSVKCTLCSTIIDVPLKHIVHELDKLEKHMGKC
jgi:hypothetical protein